MTSSHHHSPQRRIISLLLLLTTILSTTSTAISSLPPNRPRHNAISFIPRGGARAKSTLTATTSTSTTSNPLHIFLTTIASARTHLLAAACARATSIFGMYPVDTIKTRMQIGGSAATNAFRWNGLYRGVWGSLVGQVPYG